MNSSTYHFYVTNSVYFYLSLASMVLGVQFFCTGLIGELITRNSSERNNYLIAEEFWSDRNLKYRSLSAHSSFWYSDALFWHVDVQVRNASKTGMHFPLQDSTTLKTINRKWRSTRLRFMASELPGIRYCRPGHKASTNYTFLSALTRIRPVTFSVIFKKIWLKPTYGIPWHSSTTGIQGSYHQPAGSVMFSGSKRSVTRDP